MTTLNLASNPRLVKEIRLARQMDYHVAVICFTFDNWSNDINDKLLDEFQEIEIYQLNAGRSNFFSWIISSIFEKSARQMSSFFRLPTLWLAVGVSKRSILLSETFTKIGATDWVIGHNPGSIYPTYKASLYFNCKSGFDVEDYHPGEGLDKNLQHITLLLMKKILPKFNYVSFASESILIECKKNIIFASTESLSIINNSFPQYEFIEPTNVNDAKLKLVWFSQHIDKGRGLEQIITIVDKYPDTMNLTLFGNCNNLFKKEWINGKDGIYLGGILSQKILHQNLLHFDVGLASEDIEADKNRSICLTNKIWAYYQSGLFILASDTPAQKDFIEKNSLHGVLYHDIHILENVLLKLVHDIDLIRINKKLRFENAQKNNWENESMKLLEIWKKNSQ